MIFHRSLSPPIPPWDNAGVQTNGLAAGIRLFNKGEFFEAHEVLEDAWRAAPREDKAFLQGLVQLAVAFHHFSTGNKVGAASVLDKGIRNLENYPEAYQGVELASLLSQVRDWQQALANGHPPGRPPQIQSQADRSRSEQ
jgi:predicted metal-dependent hydrolase